ncbi:MAG: CGGC domain-containing protein [bacterium]|nr:CGGC domain-containing protein [bacterium]
MTNIGIIHCEKNMNRCPLTNCLRCLRERKEGFADYDDCQLVGVFLCRCPAENTVELAKILKAKGADAIHFCTCTFAKKKEEGWVMGEGGFCDHIDDIIQRVHEDVGVRCVKGTAHLPRGYVLQAWNVP